MRARVCLRSRQVDHDNRFAFREAVGVSAGRAGVVTDEELRARIDAPVVTTTSNPDSVGFSRAKSGFWGWQSDKTEEIEGRTCCVFDVAGLEVVTQTRLEHLPAGHPARRKKGGNTPLSQAIHGLTGEQDTAVAGADSVLESYVETESGEPLAGCVPPQGEGGSYAPTHRSFEEYLAAEPVVPVGRPREIRTQRQKFKARLSMCEAFPLSLHDQLLPILELLAPTSQHLAELRDFISMQLPPGFPVKAEIPVHQVLSARVTFTSFSPGVDDPTGELFSVPAGYRQSSAGDPTGALSQEDEMLAIALQQSMRANTTHDFEPAAAYEQFDADLQRALLASLGADAPSPAAAAPDSAMSPARHRDALGHLDGAPAAALPGGGYAQEWVCPACTFNNAPLLLCCEMCGTKRPISTGVASVSSEDQMLAEALRLSMLDT